MSDLYGESSPVPWSYLPHPELDQPPLALEEVQFLEVRDIPHEFHDRGSRLSCAPGKGFDGWCTDNGVLYLRLRSDVTRDEAIALILKHRYAKVFMEWR